MASRLSVTVRAAAAAADLLAIAAGMDPHADDAVDSISADAVSAYRRAAPKRTRNLERGIGRSDEARGGRRVTVVSAAARNPLTGYDYVGVTRFGHRAARIYPRLDRAPATVRATKRARGRNTFSPVAGLRGNAALRFEIGGRVLYRRWVRGYHPARDWAEGADPAIDTAIEAAVERLEERIA